MKKAATLKDQRDELVSKADPEVFQIYERLLGNKKDRVVVPIENRCCSGCHIMLTAQDENLVRKGERLVFCEHCSRIHYWQESEALEGTAVATKQRRRRTYQKHNSANFCLGRQAIAAPCLKERGKSGLRRRGYQ